VEDASEHWGIAALVRRLAQVGAIGVVVVVGGAGTSVEAKEGSAVAGDAAYTRIWTGEHRVDAWITVADLAGASRKTITPRPRGRVSWGDHGALWSPDGPRLAFIREGRKASGLYVAKRDGTGLRRVLVLPGVPYSDPLFPEYSASDFAWSPNGQLLAFAYGPLRIVNSDGTNQRTLVDSLSCKPSWSPDGRSLVYLVDDGCGTERGSNEWDPGFRAVDRIDSDGSHRRRLATGSFGDVAWSPDGRHIAFTDRCAVAHGGDWACSLSLIKEDGSGRRRLVKQTWGGGEWGVMWAAAGSEVLWPSFPSFKATNVVTGRTHSVLRAPDGDGEPVGISRDGRRIAVLVGPVEQGEAPVPRLNIVAMNGRVIQPVTVPRGWTSAEVDVLVR
jgi:Tol biopolymer transport system component